MSTGHSAQCQAMPLCFWSPRVPISCQIPVQAQPHPHSSSSGDPGKCTEQGGEPLVFQMQGSSLPHCGLREEQARCEQKAPERPRFSFSHPTSRENGKGAWRGSWPTSSVQLKGTSCSWALAGITMRKCAGVLNPIYWFSGSQKGLGICPLKEFLVYMLRTTPRWMSETTCFSGTQIHVQVYLVLHSKQISEFC